MLQMLKSICEISHIPMYPIFVPSITNKCIKILQKLSLYLVEAVSNILARYMELFCD